MISWEHIIIRLLLATLFGAVIGLERERKNWAAGLRTHMMVCVGSALIMMVSTYGFSDILNTKNVVLDPSRVAAQVISGIGFIGAGTILFLRQGVVRGLTTAAGLWTVAAIGLATGGGMYFAALVTTIFAIFILWGLQPIEKKLEQKFKQKTLKITTSNKQKSVDVIEIVFKQTALHISDFWVHKADGDFVISITFKKTDQSVLNELIKQFQIDESIKEVAYKH